MTYTVGDEIHFQGYRVAILTNDAPPTVLAEFTDGIDNATLFENEEPEQTKRDIDVSETLTRIYDKMVKHGRGGLLRLSDFAKLMQEEGINIT